MLYAKYLHAMANFQLLGSPSERGVYRDFISVFYNFAFDPNRKGTMQYDALCKM